MSFIRLKKVNGIIYVYIVKNYWNKNKQSSRQKVLGYLGKVRGLETFEAKDIFERDGYACRICGYMQDLTIDHIQPLSKNGSNDKSNLWTLCRKCNGKKKDKIIQPDPILKQFRDFHY